LEQGKYMPVSTVYERLKRKANGLENTVAYLLMYEEVDSLVSTDVHCVPQIDQL